MQLQFVARQGAWHIWPHLQNYTKCTKLFAKSISCSNNKNNNKNCTKTEKLTSNKTNKGGRQRRVGRRQGKNWKLKTEITTKNVVLFFCSLLFCEYVNTQTHTHAHVAQTNTERTMLQHEAACQSDNLLVIANRRMGRGEGRQGKQLKTRHGQQKFS